MLSFFLSAMIGVIVGGVTAILGGPVGMCFTLGIIAFFICWLGVSLFDGDLNWFD